MLREQSKGPFFLGQNLSMAEINCMPFVARLIVLKQFRNFEIPMTERFNRIHLWMQAMRNTPIFRKSVESDEFYLEAFKARMEKTR